MNISKKIAEHFFQIAQEIFFVEETADDYHSITLPHLMEDQFSYQWIYNILDHKKEVERIIFEDEDPVNGFVLLPGNYNNSWY